VVRLLHNALRVDEACAADIADLGEDSGHRVLRVVRKGARKAKIPLTPATVAALDAYLADRAQRAGAADWRQLAGPLLALGTGHSHCLGPDHRPATGTLTSARPPLRHGRSNPGACGTPAAGPPAGPLSYPDRKIRNCSALQPPVPGQHSARVNDLG
jgi:integrase